MALCTSAMVTVPLLSQSPGLLIEVVVEAEQVAVVPPLVPVHVQLHGPVPETVDSVPVVQRLVVGAMVNALLLLLPQVPFTSVLLQIRRDRVTFAV